MNENIHFLPLLFHFCCEESPPLRELVPFFSYQMPPSWSAQKIDLTRAFHGSSIVEEHKGCIGWFMPYILCYTNMHTHTPTQ